MASAGVFGQASGQRLPSREGACPASGQWVPASLSSGAWLGPAETGGGGSGRTSRGLERREHWGHSWRSPSVPKAGTSRGCCAVAEVAGARAGADSTCLARLYLLSGPHPISSFPVLPDMLTSPDMQDWGTVLHRPQSPPSSPPTTRGACFLGGSGPAGVILVGLCKGVSFGASGNCKRKSQQVVQQGHRSKASVSWARAKVRGVALRGARRKDLDQCQSFAGPQASSSVRQTHAS